MKTKIQIKSISGDLLFEFEKENNTIKDTVETAIGCGANLCYANLRGSDLYGANLRGADLRGADLYNSDLRCANLYDADLYDANLRSTAFHGANLRDDALWFQQTRILPEGDLIVYKKAVNEDVDEVIVKLKIPKEAKRSQAFGRKCRAEFAEVLEIDGANEAYSRYDPTVTYRVGGIVKPKKPFDENWQEECASGIHFFITKAEAENY